MTIEGLYTAIVTPFKTDGSVDFDKFRELIGLQLEAGVAGIIPVGTTGESPTVSFDEHIHIIEVAVEACNGRAQVIAGTGSNSTDEALALTSRAMKAGIDGTLQVTPYYNKPNQEGLVRHFAAIADLGLPVVLYNVPGRSGRSIDIATIARLSEHPSIVAVKEAGGSVDRVSEILRECDITVLSGDDALALPMMAVGAVGVISVASNIIPKVMAEMIQATLAGDMEKARTIHLQYHRLFRDLFIDTNPIPIKAAMAMMGMIEEIYRLPLCSMADELKDVLRITMHDLNLIK